MGFEPTDPVKDRQFSRLEPSTARPPVHPVFLAFLAPWRNRNASVAVCRGNNGRPQARRPILQFCLCESTPRTRTSRGRVYRSTTVSTTADRFCAGELFIDLYGRKPLPEIVQPGPGQVHDGTRRLQPVSLLERHRPSNTGGLRAAIARTPSAKSLVAKWRSCSANSWSVMAAIASDKPWRSVCRVAITASGAD